MATDASLTHVIRLDAEHKRGHGQPYSRRAIGDRQRRGKLPEACSRAMLETCGSAGMGCTFPVIIWSLKQ